MDCSRRMWCTKVLLTKFFKGNKLTSKIHGLSLFLSLSPVTQFITPHTVTIYA